MDGSHFDTLTRTFATSRRHALKLVLGGAVAGLGTLAGGGGSRAARRGFPGPFNPFTPKTCIIDGATIDANTHNPSNSCQYCDPGLDSNSWSPVSGDFCGDGSQVCCNSECCPASHCCGLDETCTPCRCIIDGKPYADGTLNPAHDCQVCNPPNSTSSWSPIFDNSTCGGVAGRVCCNGECCSPTECCNGVACEECGPHCHIGGQDIDAGVVNPAVDCQVCNPELSFDTWSPADDGASCQQGDGCCTAGNCGGCSCIIDGKPVSDRTNNPRNECQECIYTRDPNDWSNRDNGVDCGNDGDRDCCDGNCCPENQCCTLDGCELCCRIPSMSDTVADGVVSPKNTCQICDAGREGHDWTILDDGEACGATGNSECCNGECCPSGQCCRNGECGLCDCQIGLDDSIPPDTVNPNNPCEICKPALNRFDWSGIGSGTACDSDGGTCCGRDCCSTDRCCLLDACGDCLCSIENHIYAPGDHNLKVDCQECEPRADPFDWSTSPDRTACGDGTRQCCGGSCCDPGFCCIDGSCQTCGCTIEGTPVAIGTLNPNNSCQKCDPTRDPLGWSSLDEGTICDESGAQCCKGGECNFCSCLIEGVVIPDGAPNPLIECQTCDVGLFPGGWSPSTETSNCGDGTQVCCNGVCCPVGNCCNLDDTCEPCRCEIGGATFESDIADPNNSCQFCDPSTSTTSWTFGPDYSVCSDPTATINRFCCQGICCQEHECCLSDGTCGPCTCVIEGVGEFQEKDRHPANECEICNPTLNRTGWTVLDDGVICGSNLDQTCCGGQCGCATGCLIDGVHYDEFVRKPGNFCDYCDPRFPDQWSPSQGGDCPPACLIEGALIRYGTPNPNNVCQICRGGDDWSPSTELFCGDGTQVCCEGECCEIGACCSTEGTCAFESCEQQGCVIDGVQYEDGTENPANACQICNISQSTTAWTSQFGQCGENLDRFCCEGVCCELGACCDPNTNACDFDACLTCAIGGVLYYPEDRNPANGCQICYGPVNKFDWTPLPDFSWCDEMQITTCCSGNCCPPGEGCQQGVCQPL